MVQFPPGSPGTCLATSTSAAVHSTVRRRSLPPDLPTALLIGRSPGGTPDFGAPFSAAGKRRRWRAPHLRRKSVRECRVVVIPGRPEGTNPGSIIPGRLWLWIPAHARYARSAGMTAYKGLGFRGSSHAGNKDGVQSAREGGG